MATINLRELRRRLPHGSIVRIAEATGISAKVVSEVLNNGWHVQLRGRVCDAALSILDESKIGTDVVKHAQEHGVVSAHSVFVPAKKRPIVHQQEEPDISLDDLIEMDFDELADFCKENELETDPEDFEGGIFTTESVRRDDLLIAIVDELGIDDNEDDEDDDDDDEDDDDDDEETDQEKQE